MKLDYHPMGVIETLKLANSKWVSHHAMNWKSTNDRHQVTHGWECHDDHCGSRLEDENRGTHGETVNSS